MSKVHFQHIVRTHQDGFLALSLIALALITRLPFASRMLFNWDSVNFALGMRGLNVTRHAPHPPGYPYFVGLARLFDYVLDDANASLVAVSILFTCLAAAVIFFLGRAIFDRSTGVIAALSLLGSLSFWTYGTIALSYITLAFFSTAMAWLAYLILFRRGRRHLLLLSVVYSIAGGFRPDLLLFLSPLWLAGLLGASWRERILNGGIVLVGFLLWFLPTAWLSGGLSDYLAVLSAYFGSDVLERYSVTSNGLAALIYNLRDLGSYLYYALYVQSLVAAAALLWVLWRGDWRRDRNWWFLAGWIAPMVAFYTFIHLGDPGYVFTILPALCLLMARFVRQLWRSNSGQPGFQPGRLAMIALVIALLANSGVFFFRNIPLTVTGVRRNDQTLAAKMRHIRDTYAPEEVLLLSFASYKHTLYYLPQYQQTLWVDLFSRQSKQCELPPGVRYVLVVDDDLRSRFRGNAHWEDIQIAPGVDVYRLERHKERRVLYGGEEIVVE